MRQLTDKEKSHAEYIKKMKQRWPLLYKMHVKLFGKHFGFNKEEVKEIFK